MEATEWGYTRIEGHGGARYDAEAMVLGIPAGSLVYKNVRSREKLEELPLTAGPCWFSFEGGYDDDGTYGGYGCTFRLLREVRLANIGSREGLRHLAGRREAAPELLPDEQYSGHKGNLRAHEALMPHAEGRGLDGTFIYTCPEGAEEEPYCARGASEADVAYDFRGASEVVLYLHPGSERSFSRTLEIIHTSGV